MFIMNRSEIIKENKDLHQFILNFFNDLDEDVFLLLNKKEFTNNIVKKSIDLGITYPTKQEHKTLYYSIAYTLFEDIEDKYGGRDNDVVFLLSIDFYKENFFIVSREIGTLDDDIEYEKSDKVYKLNNQLKEGIHIMKKDFLNYLNKLVIDRNGKD